MILVSSAPSTTLIHELGHNSGLPHRNSSTKNIMYEAGVLGRNEINVSERDRLLDFNYSTPGLAFPPLGAPHGTGGEGWVTGLEPTHPAPTLEDLLSTLRASAEQEAVFLGSTAHRQFLAWAAERRGRSTIDRRWLLREHWAKELGSARLAGQVADQLVGIAAQAAGLLDDEVTLNLLAGESTAFLHRYAGDIVEAHYLSWLALQLDESMLLDVYFQGFCDGGMFQRWIETTEGLEWYNWGLEMTKGPVPTM